MLLSHAEIARVCQEQHNAYVTAINASHLAVEWEELSYDEQAAAALVVKKVLEGEIPLAPDNSGEPISNVMKISFALYKQMVHSLATLD